MDKIITLLILVALILVTIHIYLIWKALKCLNDKISQENNEGNKTNKIFRRNHSSINPVSFTTPIQARKNLYEEYKNEKGLYEPVTPRKGIKIKEDK